MKSSRLFTVYCSLITALFLAHSLFYFFALGTDAVDDAFISFRYAQNAILGHGLFFNPGERVEGFTNFLWTAAMIPFEGVQVDVGRASMLLGALFGLGVIWLVLRFAKLVDAPKSVGILAALLLAADGSFVLWSVSGLETVMFAFFIFAGAVSYIRENRPDQGTDGNEGNISSRLSLVSLSSVFPFSGIFFALAAMTRPEGMFVFAITVAHQSTWRVLAERRLFTFRDLSRIFAFSMIFVPYWLGRWWYYKSFLPNSFHAKVSAAGPAAQIERGWNHLSQFVGVHLGWLVVIPPIAVVLSDIKQFARYVFRFRKNDSPSIPRSFWTTYLAAIIIPYAAYIVYVGGDWSVGRFFVPLLAPFYLLFSTALVDMWKWLVGTRVSNWGKQVQYVGISVSILLVGLLITVSSWNGEYGIYIRGFDAGRATLARETMGKWLKSNVAPGTLIAVDAAGQVPYFSGLPTIDMFGINDLHIGRLQVATLGQGTPGHEKFDLVYVITRQPEYVVIFGTLLDSVKEYERGPVNWTTDAELQRFLTLYQRKK
ncbi:MAG: hypothetical protein HZB51_32500 [Chloroflexi bacterium]|nr:hypothetical protein [Chloroflexota bacterium]